MKKFFALVLTGAMVLGTVAMAAPSPSASAVVVATPAEVAAQKVAEAAASENMSVAEYTNNAIVETPGVVDAVPMGVPSGIIVNGVKVNYSLTIGKVSKQVAADAANLGKVLNVLNVKNAPAGNVQFSIYSKKVVAGQKVKVYQLVNGKWVELVSSVRAEHIDVVLKGNGPIAVISK